MKCIRWTLIACLAAAGGCVAWVDSSAVTKGDGGSDAAIASEDDDAGTPKVPPRQMPRPPAPKQTDDDDDDDAGKPPVVAMPAAGSASPAKPDAGAVCDFRGLVQMKCGSAACHLAPALGSGLDLTSASLATRVEGRKGPGACASNLLIDKANPSKSALYLKITGTTCGSQMPLGGSLTPSEQACVLSWIDGL
jgi:hypothetical protein